MPEEKRGRGRPTVENPRNVRIPSGKCTQDVFDYIKASGTKIVEDTMRRSKGFREWVAAGRPEKWPNE